MHALGIMLLLLGLASLGGGFLFEHEQGSGSSFVRFRHVGLCMAALGAFVLVLGLLF